jgi:hypothetical protein
VGARAFKRGVHLSGSSSTHSKLNIDLALRRADVNLLLRRASEIFEIFLNV